MKAIWIIAKKEYQLAMRSVATYIVLTLFLVITGLFFSNVVFKIGLAELRTLFGIMHVIFIFYIPAITMGSIARERQSGTLELLSTLPIKLSSIVWGKILACLMQLKTLIFFTLVFLAIIAIFGEGIDYGAVICGYLGLILAGTAYISIGVFASSIPSNQILAFVLALVISAFFYVWKFVLAFVPMGLMRQVQYLSFDSHLESFLKGVVDTRDILFFLAVTVVFALLAEFNLQSRNMMQER
ncbi:MAG: ABC transporter permease [Candidatus Cloacimonetes bacterium HGW-Cloacimonetes-3]|jgi:ABC-2 type transport system permease protein|nr:MAG: ABC transporter permease [Candidatus Cloacimonetes bacterium HGW-Cloacimonetes-3]